MPREELYIKISNKFKKTMKEGKKFYSPQFVLYGIYNGTLPAKLGISIAKKSIPLAVQRNRIKRLIREIWRTKDVKNDSGEFVLVVKKGSDKKKNDALIKEISSIFNTHLS